MTKCNKCPHNYRCPIKNDSPAIREIGCSVIKDVYDTYPGHQWESRKIMLNLYSYNNPSNEIINVSPQQRGRLFTQFEN